MKTCEAFVQPLWHPYTDGSVFAADGTSRRDLHRRQCDDLERIPSRRVLRQSQLTEQFREAVKGLTGRFEAPIQINAGPGDRPLTGLDR